MRTRARISIETDNTKRITVFNILRARTEKHTTFDSMATVPTGRKDYNNQRNPKRKTFARKEDKRYNSRRWRTISKHQRAMYPLCEGPGCNELAHVCDHITPVTQGGDFWNGPFQSLCHSCHNRKTAQENKK